MKSLVIPCCATILALCLSTPSHAEDDRSKAQHKPRPKFSMLDLNIDGDIDFVEFSSHQIPHGDHLSLFNEIDSDKNGVICKQEFADHKPPRRHGKRKNEIKKQ